MQIKTKDMKCHTDIGGEGEMISCNYNKKASEVHLHPSSIILQNMDCDQKLSEGTMKCKLKPLKQFKPGDKYSSDFNYCEMLDAGKKAKISDGARNLNKLFDSYEDVNYHEASAPLIEAINLIKKGKRKLAEEKLKEFNKLSEETAEEVC